MNIGVTEISPRAVQRAAEKNFKSGYYCCEALMCTIRESLQCHPVWLSEQANRDVSVAHSTEVCLHLECSSEEQSRTGQPIRRA